VQNNRKRNFDCANEVESFRNRRFFIPSMLILDDMNYDFHAFTILDIVFFSPISNSKQFTELRNKLLILCSLAPNVSDSLINNPRICKTTRKDDSDLSFLPEFNLLSFYNYFLFKVINLICDENNPRISDFLSVITLFSCIENSSSSTFPYSVICQYHQLLFLTLTACIKKLCKELTLKPFFQNVWIWERMSPLTASLLRITETQLEVAANDGIDSFYYYQSFIVNELGKDFHSNF